MLKRKLTHLEAHAIAHRLRQAGEVVAGVVEELMGMDTAPDAQADERGAFEQFYDAIPDPVHVTKYGLAERSWHAALAYARAAAPQAEAAQGVPGWMPIDTAPKTGRTLLLGYPNALGKWRTTRGQWMSENYIAEYWEDPEDAEPGWYETPVEAEDIPNCWFIEPTHWMPLPAAPDAAPSPDREQRGEDA